jgi:hypothetical protein
MLAQESPADYLAAALTNAAIRGVTTPLAALAAPAWARRRLRTIHAAAVLRPDPNQGGGEGGGERGGEGGGAGASPRRQLEQLPPPPEAVAAWHGEWSAWRLGLRRALRTQLLPLLAQVATLVMRIPLTLTLTQHIPLGVLLDERIEDDGHAHLVRVRVRASPNPSPSPS